MSVNTISEFSPATLSDTEAAAASEGKNTELLAVRVSPALMEAVKLQAERSGKSVPEVVRFLLLFPLTPQLATVTAKQLDINDPQTQVDYHNGRIRMASAWRQIDKTRADCEASKQRIEITEGILNRLAEQMKQAEALANEAWLMYLNEYANHDIEIEDDPEAHNRRVELLKVKANAQNDEAPTPTSEAAPMGHFEYLAQHAKYRIGAQSGADPDD